MQNTLLDHIELAFPSFIKPAEYTENRCSLCLSSRFLSGLILCNLVNLLRRNVVFNENLHHDVNSQLEVNNYLQQSIEMHPKIVSFSFFPC